MRLTAKVIRMSHAKFHCIRLIGYNTYKIFKTHKIFKITQLPVGGGGVV